VTLVNVYLWNLRHGGPWVRVTRDDGTEELYDECEILGPSKFVRLGDSVFMETDAELKLK